MKKLLLAAVTFVSLAALWFVPATANAAAVTVTSYMGANSDECEQPGYINPGELSFNYNDKVTIQFKNEQNTKVEVRNVPGGTFEVPADKTVSRTFQAKGNFVYAIWSTEGNCEKATARLKVNGGWPIRLWPWVLALAGSALVIWIVTKVGYRTAPPKGGPPAVG